MLEKEEKLPEIYSEEVQEIMSRPPKGLIRSGMILLSGVVFLLLLASWFIKYPDIISAQIKLVSSEYPASLVAKSTGKVVFLPFNDGATVQSGDILAMIENTAVLDDVLFLEKALRDFNSDSDSSLIEIGYLDNIVLGEIQASFNSFQQACSNYEKFLSINLLARKISSLQSQLATTIQYYKRYEDQCELQFQDLQIASREFSRDSTLFSSNVISAAEYDQSKTAYIQRKQSYLTSKSTLSNIRIQQSQLEQQIIENQLAIEDETKSYLLAIDQTLSTLQQSILTWKQQYLLISPIAGKLTYTNIRKINQNVNAGDVVLTVVPENESEMFGLISIPMQGAGKVKVGQLVNIKFDNYPYMEFGMVKGIVGTISLIPSESNYIVEISLPDGLMTNYHKELYFVQEMSGTAEIITEDLRLIERFINPIKSLIKRNSN
ncbi:MAG: HlyD family efflux transporter periplasmic adaptor subunit [Bacteroidales bacterium]|nr:HlyD family efflux transporter periplasmic adaptor subunit [Bacteroidales bacterium]